MVYSAFSPSVLGMMSQSHALNTIGANIANVNTGGFKGRETRFSSLVSEPLYHESDLGGVRPWDFQRIDQQGLLAASASQMDLGINGRGFFVLSDSFAGDGHTFYGRDGAFQMRTVNDVSVTADDGSTITVKDGYLADKNGYFVLGWEPDADGTFPSSGGALTPLRIDPYAFTDEFEPTTEAVLGVNLPAGAATNRTETYSANLIDSAGDLQTVTYSFLKSHVTNQWIVVPKTDGTATAQEDTVTLAGTPEVGDRYTVTINGSSTSYTASQNDTVTLSGTVEAGDVYSVTINGTTFTYTAAGGDTLTTIRDDLLNQITLSSLPVTAASNGTDGISVTSKSAFTLTASATNGGVTADNAVATTTAVDTLADIRDELVDQINDSDYSQSDVITAAASGTDGITVTADSGGEAFALTASALDGGSTADNTATTTTTAIVLTFNADGTLDTPQTQSMTMSFDGGGTATVDVDLSDMTQYAGEITPITYSRNGFAAANMETFRFEENGNLVGVFEDGDTRVLYKVPLAIFNNPNGLEEKNGNVWVPTTESGEPEVVAAFSLGAGSFMPNSNELSNVDIAQEFSAMIMTQNAYNSSAQVFKTIDEMVQVARDLKR